MVLKPPKPPATLAKQPKQSAWQRFFAKHSLKHVFQAPAYHPLSKEEREALDRPQPQPVHEFGIQTEEIEAPVEDKAKTLMRGRKKKVERHIKPVDPKEFLEETFPSAKPRESPFTRDDREIQWRKSFAPVKSFALESTQEKKHDSDWEQSQREEKKIGEFAKSLEDEIIQAPGSFAREEPS